MLIRVLHASGFHPSVRPSRMAATRKDWHLGRAARITPEVRDQSLLWRLDQFEGRGVEVVTSANLGQF